jgi:hypothetical protein
MNRRPASRAGADGAGAGVPIPRGQMLGRGIDPTLVRKLERGEYVVDARAVAEAMLASGVFVAAKSRQRPIRAKHDQSASG